MKLMMTPTEGTTLLDIVRYETEQAEDDFMRISRETDSEFAEAEAKSHWRTCKELERKLEGLCRRRGLL